MLAIGRRKAWATSVGVVLITLAGALVGVAGCAGSGGVTTTTAGAYARAADYATTAAAVTTTAAPATTVTQTSQAGTPAGSSSDGSSDVVLGGPLTAVEAAYGQKLISDAQIEIEVENGKFQIVFAQAMGLAARYGGYLLSSSASAGAGEDTLKSGTVSIRVPGSSFSQALADASNLGTLKSQTLSTQDVTEEYVDLQARIKNAQARVDSLVALFADAKTIDEIIKMQQYVLPAQQDLEELQGRMRYLTEHTDYSTLTISIREKGAVVAPEPVVDNAGWGVGNAFKDAGHYLVRVFNGIVRGLGVIIPVLVLLAIVGYVGYRVFRRVTRRNREEQPAARQDYRSGWGAATGQMSVPGAQMMAAPSAAGGATAMAPTGPAREHGVTQDEPGEG